MNMWNPGDFQSSIITLYDSVGIPSGLAVKESTCNARDVQETQVQSLGQEDPLGKEMATHSSILAWKIQVNVGRCVNVDLL